MTVVIIFESKIKERILKDIAPDVIFKVFDDNKVYASNILKSKTNEIIDNSESYSEEITTVRRFSKNVSNRTELLQLI